MALARTTSYSSSRKCNALNSREISTVVSFSVVVLLQLVLVHDPLSELFRMVWREFARPKELLTALVDPLVGHPLGTG